MRKTLIAMIGMVVGCSTCKTYDNSMIKLIKSLPTECVYMEQVNPMHRIVHLDNNCNGFYEEHHHYNKVDGYYERVSADFDWDEDGKRIKLCEHCYDKRKTNK